MATATSLDTHGANSDVVRRNIKRDLDCDLTDEEFTRIAKQRAHKELEVAELESDLAKEKKRRMDQIELLADEVATMGRELATGKQKRTVPCNEIFVKHDDGTGWIHTIRLDTFAVEERRPATAHETQRYLPGTAETAGGLLDQATAVQRLAASAANSEQPKDDTDDVPAGGDVVEEGDAEDKPTRAARGARGGRKKGGV